VCAIGRGEQNDVRLLEDSVSKFHATLLLKGDAWYVVDLRSANGTFVDGSRIAGERLLPAGATLTLGSVEMTFRPGPRAGDAARSTVHLGGLLRRLSRLW
jgi:pSer/pThr/pTyr-binding forkhead associated (FHA) protein